MLSHPPALLCDTTEFLIIFKDPRYTNRTGIGENYISYKSNYERCTCKNRQHNNNGKQQPCSARGLV